MCVEFKLLDGETTPASIVSLGDSEILAEIGPVSCIVDCPAKPHPAWNWRLTPGEGLREVVKPVDGVAQPGTTWTWRLSPALPLPPPTAISSGDFQLLSRPAPDGTQWFFGDPPQNGEISLFLRGDWERRTEIDIRIKVQNTQGDQAYALESRIVLESGGSLLECAATICSFLRTAFSERELPVSCRVRLEGGLAKLTLELDDGSVDMGHFVICATPPPVEPPQPSISGVDPSVVGVGDIVTIRGTGFGDDPDALLVMGACDPAVPLQVIESSDSVVRARVGTVSPGTKPGPIRVARGVGLRGDMKPTPKFLDPPENVWAWLPGDEPSGSAVSDKTVEFLETDLGDGGGAGIAGGLDRCSTSVVENGQLKLFLPDGVPVRAAIRVELGALNKLDGRGLRILRTVAEQDLSPGEFADSLAELLRWAFMVVADSDIGAETSVDDLGAEVVFSLPSGADIHCGHVQVCVTLPPATKPVVDSVSADVLATGDTVIIEGSGFGNDPDDLSISAVGRPVPIRATGANGTEIRARVGPVLGKPVDFKPGPIRVVRGQGGTRSVKPVEIRSILDKPIGVKPVDLLKPIEPWAWIGNDANAAFSKPVDFKPVDFDGAGAGLAPIDFCLFGTPDGGELVTTLASGWTSGTTVRLYARFTGESGKAYHLESQDLVFGGGDARQCALGLLGVLQSSFLLMHGDLVIGQVDDLGAGGARIRLSILNDPLVGGYLIACGTLGAGASGSIPGDCNSDGRLDLSDPVCMLGFLFLGNPRVLPCGEAGGAEPDPGDLRLLDADDNGGLDLTDPVRLLNYLFLGGPSHVLGTDCELIETCPDECSG